MIFIGRAKRTYDDTAPFEPEEDEFIRANYRRIRAHDIGIRLGRPVLSIRRRAYYLGLAKRIETISVVPKRSIVMAAARAASGGTVTPDEILSELRARKISMRRWIAIHLIRRHDNYSLPAIGAAFDLDHTTILHALRGVKKIVDNDDKKGRAYRARIEAASVRFGLEIARVPDDYAERVFNAQKTAALNAAL